MAALDFPASPVNGQLFVAGNGVTYQYNSAKGLWLATTLSGVVATPTWDYRNDAVLGSVVIPQDDTIPQITEGQRLFSRSFTAVDPSHPIEVDADAQFGSGGAGVNCVLALFIDGAPDAVATKIVNLNVAQAFITNRLRWRGVLSAGAHTFEVRWGHAGNIYLARNDNGRLYGGTLQATMSVSEIGVGPQGPPGPQGAPGASTNFLQRKVFQTGALVSGLIARIPLDNTIPQSTEGTEVMNLAVTPMNPGSMLDVTALINGSGTVPGDTCIGALFRDAATDAFAAASWVDGQAGPTGGMPMQWMVKGRIPSGSTAPTTIRCRAGCSVAGGGNFWFNGDAQLGIQLFNGMWMSSITVEEVMP